MFQQQILTISLLKYSPRLIAAEKCLCWCETGRKEHRYEVSVTFTESPLRCIQVTEGLWGSSGMKQFQLLLCWVYETLNLWDAQTATGEQRPYAAFSCFYPLIKMQNNKVLLFLQLVTHVTHSEICWIFTHSSFYTFCLLSFDLTQICFFLLSPSGTKIISFTHKL